MAWFKREKKSIDQPTPPDERRVKTEGLWIKCENCRTIVWKKDLEANWRVCPKCQHHFRLNAPQRLELLLDARWVEHDAALASSDPLHFVDTKPYAARLKERAAKAGHGRRHHHGRRPARRAPGDLLLDGVRLHRRLDGRGGRRESDAGDRSAPSHRKLPLIIVSCSGGARMMEGTISLMQLAKVSAALARLDEVRLPLYFRAHRPDHRRRHRKLRHAGRPEHRRARRADRICRPARDRADHPPEACPKAFRRAEFLLEHGFLDAVVHRKDLKTYIASALDFFLA